jgi:thioredoxin reductase
MADALVADALIVGGGLAGLLAAARVEQLGASAILIDVGVPNTSGDLGGFAPFSGAKFSLAPAGSGIADLLGGEEALVERYRAMCSHFADLGFPQFVVTDGELRGDENGLGSGLAFRRYHSVLMSPAEIDELLIGLSAQLRTTRIIRGRVTTVDLSSGPPFSAVIETGGRVTANALIMAAGRLGSTLLKEAGVPQGKGKGIDVGVRLGFDSREPLAGLRALGPDAKFMADGVRTFCLNSPGRIFHYPGLGYQLPGGIVAAQDWEHSNVGILYRLADRHSVLQHLAEVAPSETAPMVFRAQNGELSWSANSRRVLGRQVADAIDDFVAKLSMSGLVNLPDSFDVHYPLLDWHWPVFSRSDRLSTLVPGVIAAGDASGHARGLMQAAVMGVMAAEEALS